MNIGMNVGEVPIQPRSLKADATAHWRARDEAVSWMTQGCAEPNPFYAPMLLDPALDALDPDSTVTLIEARDESGALIARLPVVAASRHGRFPVRHAANWIYRHCFYGAPLLREGAEQQGWAGLLRTLDAARWSGSFLHLRGIDPDGPVFAALRAVCAAEGRRCEEVGRYERAMLRSDLNAEAYWTANVRAKKRKELRRLQSRLAEEGEIARRHLVDPAELPDWLDAFLTLEAKGWKGEQGTALGSRSEDAAFLRQACTRAQEAGQLDMLRIDCGGKAIAMLINFTGAAGGFSFKIAIDPDYARYSPGILIEQDNLARMLDDHVAPWMDSCAAPDHPMIDSLWGQRRAIAQYRVALRKPGPGGRIGRLLLPAMTLIEQGYARIKSGVRT